MTAEKNDRKTSPLVIHFYAIIRKKDYNGIHRTGHTPIN